MIPPVMDAGTDAWTNPAHLKGTNIFDHKMAAKITELLSSKLSEQSVKSPMGTVEADNLGPMSEEVVREDGKIIISYLVITNCYCLSNDSLVEC